MCRGLNGLPFANISLVTKLMARSLETQASRMKERADNSITIEN